MKHTSTLLFCLITLTFTSCQRIFTESDAPNTPVNVFDYLWNKVDQQYTFFDVKDVDWEAVYETYRPKVYDEMDNDSLFRVCAAILNTLQDGHTNLISPFDISRPDSLMISMSAENQYDADLVYLNYLTENGAKVLLLSHLGKVKTDEDKAKNDMSIVAKRLAEVQSAPVTFVNATRGEELENAVKHRKRAPSFSCRTPVMRRANPRTIRNSVLTGQASVMHL